MAKKVIFLDRDGTLNLDKGYTYKVEDYLLLDGVKAGLKRLVDAGFGLIILTSQSGIGRGMYTESQYREFMEHLQADLASAGVTVLGAFHCSHHAEHGQGEYKIDCDCRKPKPGLMRQAEKVLGPFDYEQSWAIGDSVRDLEMAKNAHPKIKTILLPKNFATEHKKPLEESDYPDYSVNNFLEAVAIIQTNQ